jgi:DNA-directed RNA polymerase subunit RPC12/RpoP
MNLGKIEILLILFFLVVLTVLGFGFVIAVIRLIGRKSYKACPFCAERIKKEAIVCPYCSRDIARS